MEKGRNRRVELFRFFCMHPVAGFLYNRMLHCRKQPLDIRLVRFLDIRGIAARNKHNRAMILKVEQVFGPIQDVRQTVVELL